MICKRLPGVAGFLVASVLGSHPVQADAIDGDWCSMGGKHFTIEGSEFTTQAGRKISGKYDRHAYSYIVPATEPGAGSTVTMSLVSDDVLHLKPGVPEGAEIQVWKRCDLTS